MIYVFSSSPFDRRVSPNSPSSDEGPSSSTSDGTSSPFSVNIVLPPPPILQGPLGLPEASQEAAAVQPPPGGLSQGVCGLGRRARSQVGPTTVSYSGAAFVLSSLRWGSSGRRRRGLGGILAWLTKS